jgi:hypothetical protein
MNWHYQIEIIILLLQNIVVIINHQNIPYMILMDQKYYNLTKFTVKEIDKYIWQAGKNILKNRTSRRPWRLANVIGLAISYNEDCLRFPAQPGTPPVGGSGSATARSIAPQMYWGTLHPHTKTPPHFATSPGRIPVERCCEKK